MPKLSSSRRRVTAHEDILPFSDTTFDEPVTAKERDTFPTIIAVATALKFAPHGLRSASAVAEEIKRHRPWLIARRFKPDCPACQENANDAIRHATTTIEQLLSSSPSFIGTWERGAKRWRLSGQPIATKVRPHKRKSQQVSPEPLRETQATQDDPHVETPGQSSGRAVRSFVAHNATPPLVQLQDALAAQATAPTHEPQIEDRMALPNHSTAPYFTSHTLPVSQPLAYDYPTQVSAGDGLALPLPFTPQPLPNSTMIGNLGSCGQSTRLDSSFGLDLLNHLPDSRSYYGFLWDAAEYLPVTAFSTQPAPQSPLTSNEISPLGYSLPLNPSVPQAPFTLSWPYSYRHIPGQINGSPDAGVRVLYDPRFVQPIPANDGFGTISPFDLLTAWPYFNASNCSG